jgi:hypothetical protein
VEIGSEVLESLEQIGSSAANTKAAALDLDGETATKVVTVRDLRASLMNCNMRYFGCA